MVAQMIVAVTHEIGNPFILNQTQYFTASYVQNNAGWWFQPLWKILVKIGIFPK